MRAFASDLDRTLIYSRKMIDTYGMDEDVELIETLEGREISYVSLKTKETLKQLSKQMLFIPVTTRTVEQYTRISVFNNEIQPKYVIACNGGVILESGKVLNEWSNLIEEQLRDCTPLHEITEQLERLPNADWIERIRQADQMFIYLIINRDKISQDEIIRLRHWANRLDWQMSLQGRKLYFIPKPINKWKAVQFLCQKLKIEEVYTAGDSLLDYELIKHSDFGISPAHGEVLRHFPDLNQTKVSGMQAADELLEAVQNRVFLHSK